MKMFSLSTQNIKVRAIIFYSIALLISFVSDIILNDLSRFKQSGQIITSLRPYFDNKPILVSAFLASLTIFIALLCVSIPFSLIFNSLYPRDFKELGIFILIAYPIGYVLDKLIYNLNIFGDSLKPYYKVAGAGHWGALAFLVAIIPAFIGSYSIQFFKDELCSVMNKCKNVVS